MGVTEEERVDAAIGGKRNKGRERKCRGEREQGWGNKRTTIIKTKEET